jgi:hypothetical protein
MQHPAEDGTAMDPPRQSGFRSRGGIQAPLT